MSASYRVIYDEQCEVCQAGVSWLKFLDQHKRVVCLPIDPDNLRKIHSSLTVDDCLRELHVVTPEGRVFAGADAVIMLARLFRQTWLIGTVAGLPVLRRISRRLYRFVSHNLYAL